MPKKIGTRKTGHSKTYGTRVICETCLGEISSLETNCPNCGATRKVDYTHSEVTETHVALNAEDTARVKAGAHPCAYCTTLTWRYDAAKNKYVCPKCSASTGEKSDYVLGGGPEKPIRIPHVQLSVPEPIISVPLPLEVNWKPIALIASGVVGIILIVWLIISLTTTHEVRGYVALVYWQRSAHQAEYQLLDGESFDPPSNATPMGSAVPKISGYQDNIVDYTHGVYSVTSTPEKIGETHGTYYVKSTPEVVDVTYDIIPLETEGAYYNGPEYDCGEPTMEAGGSVSYDQCVDVYQYDSTWGEGKSEPTYVYAPEVDVEVTTEPTVEYAPVVDVEQTTMPTPVYGTPTPIYRDWYVYKYWTWVNVGALPNTSGSDNKAFWPQGQEDEYHMVVNDIQYYKVVVSYDNGKEVSFEGQDPSILEKYILDDIVVGRFNAFNVFVSDNK